MKSAGLWNVSGGIFRSWKTSIKKLRINIFMETDPYLYFLARPQETSLYGNINQINCGGGKPARAPLLIKPSAEDRTLIKKPCRTVVPPNQGSGRAITFFFFPPFCGAIISDCSQSKDSRLLDAQTSTVRHTDSPICSHQTQRQTGEIKQSHREFKISSRC